MTTNKRKPKSYWPIFIIFLAFNALFIAGRNWLIELKAQTNVLIIGNCTLFIATLLSFFLYRRALMNNRPQAFLKYIYGGMFLKMLICLLVAFVYIASFGKDVNKPGLFGCMFLYFLYTFVEVSILLRLSKDQKNAQTRSPS